MEPLTIKTFDPILIEAIESEQKKAGDITYTSVKFSYNEGKVPPVRVNGEFKLFNFKGNYFEKLEEMIARETCRYVGKFGGKKLKQEEFKLVKDNSQVGKVVYARIYTRFEKSRCLITNKSGDKSRLTLGDLVGEKFKGSCIIKLYQAFVGSNKSITFSIEEILVKEMESRKSFFDEYEELIIFWINYLEISFLRD